MARKCRFGSRPILFASVLALCCFFLLLALYSHLPQPNQAASIGSSAEESPARLGALGEAMVSMLPDDLAFTVFVPSEEVLEDALGVNGSDASAVLSRLMGFAAVPRHLPSGRVGSLAKEEVVAVDSVSGYALRVWRSRSDGGRRTSLVVNDVEARQVDLRRGEIIVHLMDGVVMDPEFARSVLPN